MSTRQPSGSKPKRPPPRRGRPVLPRGLYYERGFIRPEARAEILSWLKGLRPIWEQRYSTLRPPPAGQEQRRLLRPVYWLGSWQFACLDYYHPPKGIHNRAVRAEPFPPVLERLVNRIENIARAMYAPQEMPARWRLNTCLVNFYGSRVEKDGRRVDTARVGEHKDFEPGPVASLSLGERALFQFVSSRRPGTRDEVVLQQWLDDGSLQIFGGRRWKDQLFHRVQRVDRRAGSSFRLQVEGFETRRVNFTFRYVPDEHVVRYSELPATAAQDVAEYVSELAKTSSHWAAELKASDGLRSGA